MTSSKPKAPRAALVTRYPVMSYIFAVIYTIACVVVLIDTYFWRP